MEVRLGNKSIHLTNLRKVFWPDTGFTKGDLIQFYLDISHVLLPHLAHRAMVMKRYPNGISGDFFFMKRAPSPRPEWIETCSIEHASGNVIDFPVIRDVCSLLWVINLGCIDLNPWYARCDDVDRPDYLHFDLDPVKGATWDQMLETAAIVHHALDELKLPSFIKTTGSKGFHVYVPIVAGPPKKGMDRYQAFCHYFGCLVSGPHHCGISLSQRPSKRVLVDYNQMPQGPDACLHLFCKTPT